MEFKKTVGIILISIIFLSCNKKILIETNPANSQLTLGGQTYTSPAELEIKEDSLVIINKKGYYQKRVKGKEILESKKKSLMIKLSKLNKKKEKSESKKKETSLDKEKSELEKLLTEGSWFFNNIPDELMKDWPDDLVNGYYQLQFLDDKNFKISIIDRFSESSEEGVYEVNNNDKTVKLMINKPFGMFKKSEENFKLHTFESLSCKYTLVNLKGMEIQNHSHKLKLNDIVTVKLDTEIYQIQILKDGHDFNEYKTTGNLDIKLFPNSNSKKLFRVNDKMHYGKIEIISREQIPPGLICGFEARTVKKFKVGNKEDYWYLIEFIADGPENVAYNFAMEDIKDEKDFDSVVHPAWVFGANIEKME